MGSRLFFSRWTSSAVLLAIVFALVPDAFAATKYKVLHAFGAGKDGTILWGSLTLDGKGNLYGTTAGGGAHGYGTVFQLTPKPDGSWEDTILYSFRDPYKTNDGGTPSASLTFDGAGNLYGTTTVGGGSYTDGTVFELSPGTHNWSETVIHRFGRNDKASGPWGGVIRDGSGHLYGVGGCAFKLSSEAGGRWNEHILHCFPAFDGDGRGELDRPILDATGNLYGTTEKGGSYRGGTAYELRLTSAGWKERILHSFPAFSSDGQVPGVGALVLDGAGNLYGTTGQGGSNTCGDVGCGTVFKLTRKANGDWKETILYSFAVGSSGSGPGAGVVLDQAGNLYGTTIYGGTNCYCGVVYKLAPQANGKWRYTVLHTFIGSDGAQPDANLILDDKGNLYGTTAIGGAAGAGVAFELTP